jgi:t-SNARE complex subunit (syntaxin)
MRQGIGAFIPNVGCASAAKINQNLKYGISTIHRVIIVVVVAVVIPVHAVHRDDMIVVQLHSFVTSSLDQ